MDEEIRELLGRTARTRYQLLKTEMQTFFMAVEMAQFELSVGNTAVAESEIAAAENGARVIQRFATRLPAEQRMEMEARLSELRAMLDALKAELRAQAGTVGK